MAIERFAGAIKRRDSLDSRHGNVIARLRTPLSPVGTTGRQRPYARACSFPFQPFYPFPFRIRVLFHRFVLGTNAPCPGGGPFQTCLVSRAQSSLERIHRVLFATVRCCSASLLQANLLPRISRDDYSYNMVE